MKRLVLSLLITCIILVDVLAQQDDLVERTVCVLDAVNLSDDPESMSAISSLIADTLAIMIDQAGYTVIDNTRTRETAQNKNLSITDFLEKDTAISLANELKADVAVVGFYRVEDLDVLIGIKAYDIFTRRIATAVTKIGPAGLGIYDTVDEVSALIADKIREKLKPLPASVITLEREKINVKTTVVEEIVSIGKEVKIVFTSKDEGAGIYLGGERLVATVEKGRAEFTAKADTVLEVTVKKNHYHDYNITFPVKQAEETIPVPPLYRRTKWDVSLMVSPQFPIGLGAQFRYFFVPDVFCVSANPGLYYFPQSYAADLVTDQNAYMLSVRLDFGAGWYPFIPPRFPIRPMLFAGAIAQYFSINQAQAPGLVRLGPEFGVRLDINFPQMSIFGIIGFNGTWAFPSNTAVPGFEVWIGAGVTWKG